MTSKAESIWNSIGVPQADLEDLERNLGKLSLRYMKQSMNLPLSHQKQITSARLYSAARTLQEALREGTVENAIFEIGSNLIGCEQIALLVMSKEQGSVNFIGSAEFSPKQLDILRRNAKRIIEEAPADSMFIKTGGEDRSFLPSLGISARIPFSPASGTRGAIIFFDLLPQRNGLDVDDRELLQLLCTYAGACLAANRAKHHETCGWVQL